MAGGKIASSPRQACGTRRFASDTNQHILEYVPDDEMSYTSEKVVGTIGATNVKVLFIALRACMVSKQGRSLPELEQLEKDLRKALDGVCGERDRIVQEQLAKEEQRLCVVCQVRVQGLD